MEFLPEVSSGKIVVSKKLYRLRKRLLSLSKPERKIIAGYLKAGMDLEGAFKNFDFV